MPLKVTIFINQGPRGFTETYYASGSNPLAFIQSVNPNLWSKCLQIRSTGTQLYAVRASLVGPPRTSYTQFFGSQYVNDTTSFVTAEPDVVSTDAVIRIICTNGKSVPHFLRGLADADVAVGDDLTPSPSALLLKNIGQYVNALAAANMELRFQYRPPNNGLQWYPVVTVQGLTPIPPQTSNPNSLCITAIAPPPTPPAGQMVVFQGRPTNDLPGFPNQCTYASVTTAPTGIIIPWRYRAAVAEYAPTKLQFCIVAYDYESILVGTTQNPSWQFERFSEHKTGRPFGVPRGRARSLVKRQ